MSKRRDHGDGGIDPRGENSWRLRYRIKGRRISQTFHGSLSDARKELRRLLKSGDDGTHVAPDKITLGQWVEQWIAAGAPARRQKRVRRGTVERYAELLRGHVVPTLGKRPLQQVQPTEIDVLYQNLEGKIAPSTAHHVHTIFGSCLNTAVRKGLLAATPMARVEKIPSPGESNHGMVLDGEQLRTLVEGFKGSALYPIVAVAAFTGARRNEILALRWTDIDFDNKTLRIERAVEQVRGQPLAVKEPKTARGTRTIAIDDELVNLLRAERDKHLRLMAGVPDGAEVLVLVKLPDNALVFPNPFRLAELRTPNAITMEFVRKAHRLGFPNLRFHDLRGTHETLLLDAGVPVHVVAARCGHDPAVLLRSYAKQSNSRAICCTAYVGSWHKADLTRCPLPRRYRGLSGHGEF